MYSMPPIYRFFQYIYCVPVHTVSSMVYTIPDNKDLSTSIGYRSDTKVSNRCLINGDPGCLLSRMWPSEKVIPGCIFDAIYTHRLICGIYVRQRSIFIHNVLYDTQIHPLCIISSLHMHRFPQLWIVCGQGRFILGVYDLYEIGRAYYCEQNLDLTR